MASAEMSLPEPEQISDAVHGSEEIDAQPSKPIQSGVSSAQALGRLGIRLCMQERYPESLEALRGAVALSPNDPLLLNNLAVVLERTGQTAQAIRTVERSLALSNGQPDSWLFLGNMHRTQGNLNGAQAAYEAALSQEAMSPLAWQGLGLIKQAQRKYLEAIECFITCIKQSQATAPMLSILGQLFYLTGQFEKSRDAYAAAVAGDAEHPVYRQMHRETQFICAAIRGDSIGDAINTYLLYRAAFPGKEDKGIDRLLQMTFALLSAHGHRDAARCVGAKRVELSPTSATAAYLLQAITGDSFIVRSPDAYIVEYFDEFADGFDERLLNTLDYDVPRTLGTALAGLIPAGSTVDVLDAGCGTGLCGPWVRDFSASLSGVDLSPRMLHHARQRQIYDRLVCGELTSFLADSRSSFDAVIAADVLIYFGDLVPLAAAVAESLRAGGLFAFSTERAAASGHQLLSSGRFAHHPDYVRSVFGVGFVERISHDTTIRLDASQPIAGNIFVFQRR